MHHHPKDQDLMVREDQVLRIRYLDRNILGQEIAADVANRDLFADQASHRYPKHESECQQLETSLLEDIN